MTRATTDAGPVQVLVAGAGPAGLMMGCELARRGVDCLVVERDEVPFGGSRGKGLQPRTLEIFEDLGILDEVRAHGGLYPPLMAHSGGQIVFEGRMDPLRDVTPDVPYPNVWMLPQWRTGEILRARLAALGGQVRYGTELVSVSQDGRGIRAVLRDGGADLVVRASYLVGADGGHSTVRRALGIGFAGETREEQRMIVADITADGVSREFWHVWTGGPDGPDGFRLGLCPLAGTGAFQLTAPVTGARPPELTLSGLQELVDAAAGPDQIRVTALTWSSLYRANIRMAGEFRAGQVFLVGDAAHVHSPAGGQGLNTGIQDSYNLGWKLAAALGGAPDWLLDSYAGERLPVAAGVLGISTRLHDKAAGGEPDAHLRDDPELRQLNLGYRASTLTGEYRVAPGKVRAGDRAPDATGQDADGKPIRVFELIHGARFTLLAFGPGAAELAAGLLAELRTAPVQAVEVLGDAGGADGRRADSAAGHTAGSRPADRAVGHTTDECPADSTAGHTADGRRADSAAGHTAGSRPADRAVGHTTDECPAYERATDESSTGECPACESPAADGAARVAEFADTGGWAREGYGIAADQDVLLVIRPDGYLGLALDAGPRAAEQVRAYLGGLYLPRSGG